VGYHVWSHALRSAVRCTKDYPLRIYQLAHLLLAAPASLSRIVSPRQRRIISPREIVVSSECVGAQSSRREHLDYPVPDYEDSLSFQRDPVITSAAVATNTPAEFGLTHWAVFPRMATTPNLNGLCPTPFLQESLFSNSSGCRRPRLFQIF
jgi:hypothetical protein